MKIKVLSIAVLFGLGALLTGCTGGEKEKQQKEEDQIIDEAVEDLETDFKIFKAKQVIYSLPSPLETAMIIKRAGAQYNEDILNPVSNADKYSTNAQCALNMGVYSANLSYATLFDQNQTSIKYMSVSKGLADKLGILGAIDQKVVERLEINVNNRDSIMEIISESMYNSDSFLKDAGRSQIASLILAGGWIEGLYVSTQLVKSTDDNKELIERVVDQRLSLGTLINLLENEVSEVPNEDISSLLASLKEIKTIFDTVKETSSKSVPVKEEGSNVTVIKSNTEIVIPEDLIEKLVVKVEELRNSITK